MKSAAGHILTLNGGSSSIKFALYERDADDPAHKTGVPLQRILLGKLDRIGSDNMRFTVRNATEKPLEDRNLTSMDSRAAADFLLNWLARLPTFASVQAVSHRLVHGMQHSRPERITPELLEELRRIIPYDPDHLPLEIELIENFRQRFPNLSQVACFDTAFHHGMPRVATLLTLPRRYQTQSVRRYGFHGLSYEYQMEELGRLDDTAAKRGRVILAHLGNGASLAAVLDGKSLDTSMGFTPVSGLMMGTRSGDLDPGLVGYLARTEGMTAERFEEMASHESGLLGVSETHSDVRDLLARASEDARAAEAIDLFCYQAKKGIGSFAAALGGVDTLVFAGGIGENSPEVRARICKGLGFLGIELEKSRNAENAPLISTNAGKVSVRVIRTDEEHMLAQAAAHILD